MNYLLDIEIPILLLSLLMLLIPVSIFVYLKVPYIKELAVSLLRMIIQLFFVGVYLGYLFKANNVLLTITWFLIMVLLADYTILSKSGVKVKRLIIPLGIAVFSGAIIPLAFFLYLLKGPEEILNPQYFIPLAGMILGNSLRAIVIALKIFYRSIHDDLESYYYRLSFGKSLFLTILPYMRRAMEDSLAPTIASMATVGIVSLPGIMTGIILAGKNPMIAIKYQILIMVSIFTGTTIAIFLSLILAKYKSFDDWGNPYQNLFIKKK